MTDPTPAPLPPRRLIADPGGRATSREVADAHLFAVDVAELSALGKLAEVDQLMPLDVADLRLLVGSVATLVADFASLAVGSRETEVLVDLFDRLRIRVLAAEQPTTGS
jgi:hypothetical protein